MSSFVLLTRYGPPDLIVEVGKPITKDPVMLSGLFQAIVSFTNEFESPIQVMQTKGFTVHFKKLDGDYVVIVGSNHTIVGLESIVDQVSKMVEDGMKQEMDQDMLEDMVGSVLQEYLEFSNSDNWKEGMEEIPESLLEILEDIPREMYRVLFFGFLAGYNFKYPKTSSMDLNRNLVKAVQFLGGIMCTDLTTDCEDTIGFHKREKHILINGNEYAISDVVNKTELLKDLSQLVKKGQFHELKAKLKAEVLTLEKMEAIFLHFDVTNEQEVHKIDQLRYFLGFELEHYLLLRLNRKNMELVDFLQNHVVATEWLSKW